MQTTELVDQPSSSAPASAASAKAAKPFERLSIALQNAPKTSKMMWRTYDQMHKDSVDWNFKDHARLISLDYFAKRCREIHNYDIGFRLGQKNPLAEYLLPVNDDAVVMKTITFFEGSHVEFSEVTAANFERSMDRIQSQLDKITWIHVTDLRVLPWLMKSMALNDIVESMFYDLRCHSTISAISGGLFTSLCQIVIHGVEAILHKVYYYSRGNIVITYERELLAEVSDKIDPDELEDIIEMERQTDRGSIADVEAIRVKVNKLFTNLAEPLRPKSFRGICQRVMSLKMKQGLGSIISARSASLLYDLVVEGQVMSENFLHVISRTVSYLRSHIQAKKLVYRVSLNLYRNVNALRSTLRLARKLNDEVLSGIEQVMSTVSAEFENYRHAHLATAEDRLFISELLDALNYRDTLLSEQENDVAVVFDGLKHNTEVIATKDARNLNLVATVFLPLSFLAGVFGMNFYPDGGSSMDLLNEKQGPVVFVCMCCIVVSINVFFFARSGMLNIMDGGGGAAILEDKEDVERDGFREAQESTTSTMHGSVSGSFNLEVGGAMRYSSAYAFRKGAHKNNTP